MSRKMVRFAMTGLITLSMVACSGPRDVKPDVVGDLGGIYIGGTELDGTVWIAVTLVQKDVISGADLMRIGADGLITNSMRITDGDLDRGLVAFDGALYVREDIPEDDRVVYERSDLLLRVDPHTASVSEFEIPATIRVEPFVVIDGRYWQFSTWLGYLDLDTGAREFTEYHEGLPFSVHSDGDYLWLVRASVVGQIDLETGERMAAFRYGDHHDDSNPLYGRFKYVEGKYWIVGAEFEDWENAYEYDLETGEYSNPTPVDDLPTGSFESGGFRWDLYDDHWHMLPFGEPEPNAVWRQVEPESGDVIGEYRFAEYEPRFVANGYLWLTRSLESGNSELARFRLAD